ncbi:LysR family transcriptional regulator [Billgrantia diversa]|uniref:winged helix-turn-helix domain-containing protein n=1 Tax=Halomonas sp. MCCC 1A13316 TaxID=2733487 RepID=UPI0018A4CA9A|nr:LysR family transcriptional regulator [Halomonas sp. MCCC 1A13316]QOR39780.1 LysR family transcriptional regulator [Halomonas sp. MCCC 1A13316]
MAAPYQSTPRLRIQLGHAIAIGPGKAQLLETIAETGSISAAARQLGMSYRRAWLLVDTMNQCFREPLVTTATGGKGGGGAQITALGEEVLERYRRMQRIASEAVAEEMDTFASLFAESPPTPDREH